MALHNKEIELILEEYEAERKKALRNLPKKIPACILGGCLSVAAIILIAVCDRKYPIEPDIARNIFFIASFLMTIGIYISLVIAANISFVKKLKKECVPKILKTFNYITGNIEEWASNAYAYRLELKKSGLFASYNTITNDDAFCGSHKGTNFYILETLLSNEGKEADALKPGTIFKGVIINFKFNKNIKSRTIIHSKEQNVEDLFSNILIISALICLIPLLCVLFIISSKEEILQRLCWLLLIYAVFFALMWFCIYNKKTEELKEIKLEDLDFAKKYDVYSGDEIEARYLVTPAFMVRLNNLKIAFDTKNIRCSFFKDNLMIALSTSKNLFEVGNLFSPVNNYRAIESFYREMRSILGMIEYFKLNEKTGI